MANKRGEATTTDDGRNEHLLLLFNGLVENCIDVRAPVLELVLLEITHYLAMKLLSHAEGFFFLRGVR